MMEPIILIGGGGHCISCIDVLRLVGTYDIVGILDTSEKLGTIVSGIKVIGNDSEIPVLARRYKNFLITVGQIKSSENRLRIYNLVKLSGGILPIIISPKAYLSPKVSVEEGTIIMHNALINSEATIGKCCIINTGALIEHEAKVGDFCHISTQAIVNGQVTIGNYSFIGSNSVIANNVSLPEKIVIAAGACLLKSPEQPGTYFGNPARKSFKL
jgi:sugar O-acyltransferase (sialic acid O-acetyltransferase NeuD family)